MLRAAGFEDGAMSTGWTTEVSFREVNGLGAPSTRVLAYVEVTFEASIGTREISASEL